MKRWLLLPLALAGIAIATEARAGDFDAMGYYHPDPHATAFEDFTAPNRYLPDGSNAACMALAYTIQSSATALSGTTYITLHEKSGMCQERFLLTVPATQASYRATVWVRHGAAGARLNVSYPTGSPKQNLLTSARMSPTGRATSDGWIELASNDFSVDGTALGTGGVAPRVYLRISDFADKTGMDIDALELVPSGTYIEEQKCEGVRDPVCGADSICIGGTCARGDLDVPPLPDGQLKKDMVDTMEGQLQTFFGGQKTRKVDMPLAMSTLEGIRSATTPWQFWNGWATAIHELHDWHTDTYGSILQDHGASSRLNACFIEGDGDLSHGVVPSDAFFRDILVSHVGTADSGGLAAGDRLVAVDGIHPIAWARGLLDVDWQYHVASDADSFADFAEALGGSNGLIVRYAREITVIRCKQGVCDGPLETIRVSKLTSSGNGEDVGCDNRPFYHLGSAGPDPANHYVYDTIFQGRVDGTSQSEAIYSMVWDTLDGQGNPSGAVNAAISSNIQFWKSNARGVILDHRAGNGGTLDSATLVTTLARPPSVAAVIRMPIATAGYTGPDSTTEGLSIFSSLSNAVPLDDYNVGDVGYAQNLPIALITHRDGSASDYMPYGMKGAPNVKIFGPGPTAGAFSTFIQFNYWGGIGFQFASGDTISSSGISLMGKAVRPDVVVQQKQSDLIAGRDTIFEAALAWVRSELKP